jgi:uncharacterized protein (TIGR02271 family)
MSDTDSTLNQDSSDQFEPQRSESSVQHVVPVVQEQLKVTKRTHESGRVAVHIMPGQRQQHVEVPLVDEQVEVTRVPINRPVDTSPSVRQEGEVTIVPVYEERLVIRKQLVLREEIHIRRRRTTRFEHQDVTLQQETVHVLRAEAAPQEGNHPCQ